MLNELTYASFEPYLNQTFTLNLEGEEPVAFELIEVSHLGREPDEAENRRWSFALVFRGPESPVFEQQIFRLDHEEMGTLELFLVPLGPGKTGMQYEAVFT